LHPGGRAGSITAVEVLGLTCNHCGAPLEVPTGTRFITCKYCSSRLEVHQTASAAYTEVVEALTEKTEQIAGDLETIKLQNRLEQLDREWAMLREKYMTRDKDGSVSAPSKVGSVVAGILAIAMGVGWIAFTSSIPEAGFFPLFGIVFIAAGLVGALLSATQAGAYGRKKSEYEAKRREILDQLEKA
jgi:uncharacterized Zn finger protein (UPF0148 family)